MQISSASAVKYQVPVTPTAKASDERTESSAVKAAEAVSGKEHAVAVKGSGSLVNVTA